MNEGIPHSESSEFEKERQNEISRLLEAFRTLFHADGVPLAEYGEEAFTGDAASLFTLVEVENERGEKVPKLIQVGWGEFSKETFEKGKSPSLSNFPYSIYCVTQNESYMADDEVKRMMTEDPIKYLQQHTFFVSEKGKVEVSEVSEKYLNLRSLDKDIEAVPYEELLRTVRNQIITDHSDPEEFARFLRELPDDPTELRKYMNNLKRNVEWMNDREFQNADEDTQAEVRKKHLMYTLGGMGVETTGIAAGDSRAMESILELKGQFDFETKSFK